MNEFKKEIKVDVGYTRFNFEDVNAAVLFAESAAKYIKKDHGYDDVKVSITFTQVEEKKEEEDEDE